MRLFNWLFNSQVVIFAAIMLVLVWHVLAPDRLLWLNDDQIDGAYVLLAIIAGMAVLLIMMYKGAELSAKADVAKEAEKGDVDVRDI